MLTDSMTVNKLNWRSIPISPNEICLSRVLRCGQSFRWKNIDNIWSCSLDNKVIFLKQDETDLHYSSIPENNEVLNIITDYLNLNINLTNLYKEWSLKDKNFQKHGEIFKGIRILRQDPWENLISFICSTNNNVKRISQMCDNLCIHFGKYITTFEGIKYYNFPTPESLAKNETEQKLRDLNFGYRAKYIIKTAQQVSIKGVDHLNDLRDKDYKTAHNELLYFTGVGPKVADCVCLMSLDKHDVVPIDTHVWTIAQRDYKFKSGKSLNSKVYLETGEFFKKLWGAYAGWAHSILFAADLSDLNNGINIKNGIDSKKVKKVEKVKKVKKVKEEIKVEDAEVREVKEVKDEIVHSVSGRPLRGKKRLQVAEQLVSKKIKRE